MSPHLPLLTDRIGLGSSTVGSWTQSDSCWYVEALTCCVTVYADRAFTGVTRLHVVISMGALMQYD